MKNDETLLAFGLNVAKARKVKSYSQEKLAEIADLDRTYVSSVERGQRNVSLINILKIANALSISPSELLEGIRYIDGQHNQSI